MDLFDQAKQAAAEAVENIIEQKTGQHFDLESAVQPKAEGETDGNAASTEANPLMANVIEAAKNMAMPLVEEKLKMDLDGDGQIGK